jgi:hypothetical protein
MANELAALKLVGDIKATYAAAVRSGRDLVDYALQIGRLLNQARPDIPHGEWEDYVENICGIPFGTAKRWQLVAKSVDAGLEVKSFTLNDLKSATSIEDVKKLVATSKPAPPPKPPKKEPSDGAAGSQVSSPVAPTGEQDAPDHEEPAASDTDDTDVSTDDAGSVDYDTDLDSALGGPTDLNPTKQVEPTDVECSRCKGSGRVPITAKMPPSLAESPEFINSWQDYQLHRIQKKSSLTTMAISRLFAKLEKWGPSRAIKALEHTMEKGWAGVVEPKYDASPATEKKGRAAMEFTE